MTEIHVDEGLWASSMAPEGILDRWFVQDGDPTIAGQKLAEVIVEDARHEILATGPGVLAHTLAAGDLVQPGDVIGRIR